MKKDKNKSTVIESYNIKAIYCISIKPNNKLEILRKRYCKLINTQHVVYLIKGNYTRSRIP